MKTKLILHGGFNKAKGPIQEDDDFFQEVLKDAPSELKLLLVYFAERDDMVETRIKEDKEQFTKNSQSKKIKFRIASEETFQADCAWADVIYLHGGRTFKLMEVLNKFSGIRRLLSGKIVAGDSAGANVLGQAFYSKNSKEVGEGLGILPIKVLVHYEDGVLNPLLDIKPELETLFLREYETKVFYA